MGGFIDEAMMETDALLFLSSTLTQDDYRPGETPPMPDWEV